MQFIIKYALFAKNIYALHISHSSVDDKTLKGEISNIVSPTVPVVHSERLSDCVLCVLWLQVFLFTEKPNKK